MGRKMYTFIQYDLHTFVFLNIMRPYQNTDLLTLQIGIPMGEFETN